MFLKNFSIPSILLGAAALSSGATVDNFNGGTTGTSYQLGGGAASPGVTAGGPDGDFYRLLADGVGGQTNHLVYNLTDGGAYGTINASFDYRIASAGTAADGIGFFFVPTSLYGTTGDGPNVTAEEPNTAATLAFGIDLYNTVNDYSVHWNGTEISNVGPNPATEIDSNAGVFHRVNINLTPVGNSMHVQYTVTPDIFGTPGTPVVLFDQGVVGLSPYENRIQFAGRTGGATMDADVDNLNVQYTALSSLPVASAPGLFQDFDSANTTTVNALTHGAGPIAQQIGGGPSGAFVRLINDGVNSQKNSVIFDRAADAGITNKQQTISFDMRLDSQTGDPADGVGIYLLPTAVYGTNGTGGAITPNELEQELGAVAGALHVGFDLHPAATTNDVVVTLDGNVIGRFPVSGLNLDSGVFNNAQIQLTPTAGGTSLSVILTPDSQGTPGAPVTAVSGVLLPGPTFDYRVQIGARSGGLNHSADIDNVQSVVTSLPATATTTQDFGDGGAGETGFKAYRMGAGLAPAFVDAGGGNTAIRLIHDGQNGQANTLAFDLSSDGLVTASTNTILSDFKFRADGSGAPADGFSWRLLPTSGFGTEGSGTDGSNAEEPNIAGVLALGFDFYNTNDGVNDISLHYDGAELVNLRLNPATEVNLDDGAFHDISLVGVQNGTDLDVSVKIDGTAYITHTITGFNFVDSRLEFAGRSGGANMTVDLDDISFSMIPEPSATLLLIGGLVIAGMRRRR